MNNSPKNIGPYTIEAELGRGGMGVVYQATDNRLGRQVAIKSLHDRIAVDGENVARFKREAQALAALNHTNVAGIHGLEQDGDQHFLVLEYVAGETLAQRLQRGPMPVDEALETCIQIAAGLEAAHEAGVVHRDLKPANVKITPDGQVKVLDFGLALMTPPQTATSTTDETLPIAASDPATMAGTLLGTVPYMSPEQARGEVVDKRSDIWSWAVITLECLSGSNPFAGATMSDTIAAILTAEIDLDDLPRSTPALVLPLLRRCLDRNARTRLRDAGDLHRLLQDCRHEVSRAAVGGPAPAAIVD